MVLMNKKYGLLVLLLFVFGILGFAYFSKQMLFHDTPEYIANSKILSGYLNEKIDSPHSFIYPVFISYFLKYLPSLFAIKLANILWLVLDAVALLYFFKSRKALLLLIFSPLLWVVSIQVSPVMPASFFVLLAYGFMKHHERTNKPYSLVLSALSSGLALALYAPVIIFLVFFMLSYFYSKPLKYLILFLIFMIPTFSLELLSSYQITGSAFYSLIRYYGTNIAVLFGYNPGTSGVIGLEAMSYLDLFLITPLIFLIYRMRFSEYKKEMLFLVPTILFFVVRGGQKQLFIFAPLILVIFASLIKKKALIMSIIVSMVLVIPLVYPYFQGPDRESIFPEDLKQIREDFPSYGNVFSVEMLDFYWWDVSWPRFISLEEYNLYLNNETYYKSYKYNPNQDENLMKVVEIEANLKRDSKDLIEQPLLIVEKGHSPLPGYELSKCYRLLCVYEQ